MLKAMELSKNKTVVGYFNSYNFLKGTSQIRTG